MTELDRARVFEAAMSELRCAYTLVADPQCDMRSALPHIRWAWQAVSRLSRGEVPETAGEDLSAWLAPEHLELVPVDARAQLHRTLEAACELANAPEPWGATMELPKARVLVGQLQRLGKILDAIDEQARGRSRKTTLAIRWAIRGAVLSVGVTAFILLALRPWQSEDIGSWRVAYYPAKNFQGEPELHRAPDVAFEWGLEPPTDSIPADYYTARFDTCLILDEDTDIAFMLVSNDGSRLFVDGEKLLNAWTRNGSSAEGERVRLDAGVHHLRVEYFEREHEAKVHLSASFDEREPPGPIPAEMLAFPGMEFDKDDPCAAVNQN
jgi:hypothetical protein